VRSRVYVTDCHQSVSLSHHSSAVLVAAGLLLYIQWAVDIDQLLRGGHSAAAAALQHGAQQRM